MRVRYSFSSRRTRQLKNIRKQKEKYPSLAKKIIQMSDIILEVLDSRFIKETRNIELEKQIISQGKKIIYVLNKSDLVDTAKLIRRDDILLNPRVFVSCVSRKGIKGLRDKIKVLVKSIKKPIGKTTVGVIGYPNTGKSSLINSLIGRRSAGTGADAGFTKGIQKIRLTQEIVLLDSPGIIPNKEYSSSESYLISKQTKLGARSYSQVKNPEIVVSDLIREFPDAFDKFYNIQSRGNSEILIEELGRKKGFLKKGNCVDEDKTARMILRDWQEGKIRN